MVKAADRARQLALVSRLKTTFPRSRNGRHDMITHDHHLAYMKTSHDVGGELNAGAVRAEKKSSGSDDLRALRGARLGWHLGSEERRRIGNVDVGRAIYLGLPYYARWLWSVGRLTEKHHITWRS